METPIELTILNIEKRVSELNNIDEGNNLWKSSCAAELLQQREYLKTLLPKEQEAIEEAYATGSLNKTLQLLQGGTKITPTEYFNQTYKETQNKQ